MNQGNSRRVPHRQILEMKKLSPAVTVIISTDLVCTARRSRHKHVVSYYTYLKSVNGITSCLLLVAESACVGDDRSGLLRDATGKDILH